MTIRELLEQLKQVRQRNPEIVNKCNAPMAGGGFYDFPHTRNYDTDLGFLIQMYQELTEKYDDLLISFNEFIEMLSIILDQIEVNVTNEVNKLLQEGKILLTTKYNEDDKSLEFIFSVNTTTN